MLITIETFRDRVENETKALIADLQELTGRYGTEEAHAWEKSLRTLSDIFKAPSFQPLHLYFGSKGNLALEYQLPAASSWCDVVLLGQHDSHPSAVIVELKDWMTRGDRPGYYKGLIERQGRQELHPSDQVRGYAEYCRRFHSTVADFGAQVHGCALFTRDVWVAPYTVEPNRALTDEYPVFTASHKDVNHGFPQYFRTRLTGPDENFANAFAEGQYRQDRGFVAQIGAQILSPKSNVFELLDNQRMAFNLCWASIENTVLEPNDTSPPKKVIVVKGPPGSGKSVIAARLWASLVTDKRLPDGEVIFTTTSQSQNSNWSHLFNKASRVEAASGVIRKATRFSPIIPNRQAKLEKEYGETLFPNISNWRDNLRTLRALGEPFRDGAKDNQNLISIVDEAHALINPEVPQGRGPFGFTIALGPQAYHIIRSSLVTIFLLDPLQSFRQRENTTIADIQTWATELGADGVEEISLEGNQFRCAGSVEFVSWVERVLKGDETASNQALAKQWRKTVNSNSGVDFRLFDNPEQWESELHERHEEGRSVRILASYCREWKTKDAAKPHALPPQLMDFHEAYQIANQTRYWSRIWNYVPKNGSDYTWYVSGHPASEIARDPLCEVGCPYAVRGFDYDYVGILWLNDLIWDGARWRVDPFAVEESGILALTRAARDEAKKKQIGPANQELLERVAQAYRILFTRALKGIYVWAPDPETRAYLNESLAPA